MQGQTKLPMQIVPNDDNIKMATLMGQIHVALFTQPKHPVLENLLMGNVRDQLMSYILTAPESLLYKC